MFSKCWDTLIKVEMDNMYKEAMNKLLDNYMFTKPLPVPDYKFAIPKCVQGTPIIIPQSSISITPIERYTLSPSIDIDKTTEVMSKAYEEKMKAQGVFSDTGLSYDKAEGEHE